MTVKGLTTPNRVGCKELLFCVGTRDLCVVSYWIDTLVLKNWGKYLRYFAASSSPLRGNPTQCSRGSKKNFWHRCRGGSRKQVNHTKYPSQSLSLALHYLPFASLIPLPPIHPCRFIRPLSLYPPSLSLFASFCPFLVCSYGWNSPLFITKQRT